MPSAALTAPQVAAPPSSRSATTGPSTPQAPKVRFMIDAHSTKVHTQVVRLNVVQPSRRSSQNPLAARATRPGTRTPSSSSPLAAKVVASTASAQPAPTTATSTPAATGPPISPADSSVARMPLACWSFCAGTIAGSSPVEAGLKKPVAIPVRPVSSAMLQTSAAPAITSAASRPCVTTRERSAPIITARRGMRSATTPPISRLTSSAPVRTASTSPIADADPPISSTAKASAIVTMRSPNHETAAAPSRRRKLPSRRTSRWSGKRGTTPQGRGNAGPGGQVPGRVFAQRAKPGRGRD